MTILTTFGEFIKKNFNKNYLHHIPGEINRPILGDTIRFLKYPVKMFEAKEQQYGSVFKVRLFGQIVVFMTGAEANRFVLIEQTKYFSAKEGWDFSIGELFHGGLMLKDGEEHKHHRSILQSAFKKEALANYLEQIIPVAEQFFSEWKEKEKLLIFPSMKELTLAIAGKVFFGLDFSGELSAVNEAIIRVVKASTVLLPLAIPFTTFWYGIKARRKLEEYFTKLIEEKKKNPGKDLFGILCAAQNEEGQQLTEKEIVDHLIFLLMAGHDTTASTLTSVFYELALHPEWQERLREKSLKLESEKSLDFSNLSLLEEHDWVVKECLRMHPPLILIPRKNTEELRFGNLFFPPQTAISLLIYHNHFQGIYFKEPEKFTPERFAEPRVENKKCPHAYAPFGAGQHHCLGYAFAEMQIKIILHLALIRFRWTFVRENYRTEYRSIPLQEPKDGLPMRIKFLTNKNFLE